MWSIYEIIHICTAVVYEVKSDHRSKFSNLSKRVNKKTSEKSGDIIMENLRNMIIGDVRQKTLPLPIKQQEESTDMLINRLISGSGVKRRSKVKFM